MTDDGKCYAATPAATLEQHITDSNVAKNEAEWWAYHEITRLREENARLREALKPFVPETQWIDTAIPDTRPIDVMVRAGELRAAAAAIGKGINTNDTLRTPQPQQSVREERVVDIDRTLRLLDVEAESNFVMSEAIDAINHLLNENKQLRTALKPFADVSDKYKDWGTLRHMRDTLRAARAALQDGNNGSE